MTVGDAENGSPTEADYCYAAAETRPKIRALTRAKTSCLPHLIYIYRTGKTYKANKNNFNKKLVIIKKR